MFIKPWSFYLQFSFKICVYDNHCHNFFFLELYISQPTHEVQASQKIFMKEKEGTVLKVINAAFCSYVLFSQWHCFFMFTSTVADTEEEIPMCKIHSENKEELSFICLCWKRLYCEAHMENVNTEIKGSWSTTNKATWWSQKIVLLEKT